MPLKPIPAAERFWRHVQPRENGCLDWTGARMKGGYGRFKPDNDTTRFAHRVSYQLHVGPIPAGYLVLHDCDRPQCVNPAHLKVGTHRDNSRDMVQRGRQYSPPGEDAGTSKLTERQVREIKRRYRRGYGQVLAREYGVVGETINGIMRGKSWRHLTT